MIGDPPHLRGATSLYPFSLPDFQWLARIHDERRAKWVSFWSSYSPRVRAAADAIPMSAFDDMSNNEFDTHLHELEYIPDIEEQLTQAHKNDAFNQLDAYLGNGPVVEENLFEKLELLDE